MKDFKQTPWRDGCSPLPKVAAIHDLSCFGRCALTVVVPTLSVMGTQVIPIPTCLLSSHTGGFSDMYFEDGTESMRAIGQHFERLDIKFDAIYTGFLGSVGQIELVKDFINRFGGEDTLVIVDPVMGEGGELYSTYTEELMRGMSELCRYADVITPNLTEACFLTGTEYRDTSAMSAKELENFAAELCHKLESTGAKRTVVTGLHVKNDRLCVCAKDNVSGEPFTYTFLKVNKNYPGTGDLFASVLLGAMMRGDGFDAAIHLAADFVGKVMDYSSRFDTPEREGVAFEAFLGELAK